MANGKTNCPDSQTPGPLLPYLMYAGNAITDFTNDKTLISVHRKDEILEECKTTSKQKCSMGTSPQAVMNTMNEIDKRSQQLETTVLS
ncbi:unnamed protein product [Toxocara canis]|uniref:Reverse transcriptase domain-containing protein n=1 Tax=Toxocara canis TaxID=6265 RepID=A0A183U9D1_TOXCA|nr:unnamed protein product [Toxocara canis]